MEEDKSGFFEYEKSHNLLLQTLQKPAFKDVLELLQEEPNLCLFLPQSVCLEDKTKTVNRDFIESHVVYVSKTPSKRVLWISLVPSITT